VRGIDRKFCADLCAAQKRIRQKVWRTGRCVERGCLPCLLCISFSYCTTSCLQSIFYAGTARRQQRRAPNIMKSVRVSSFYAFLVTAAKDHQYFFWLKRTAAREKDMLPIRGNLLN
jgi:hypothetical protein